MDEKDIYLKMNPYVCQENITVEKAFCPPVTFMCCFFKYLEQGCKEVIPYHMLRHSLYTARLDPVSNFSLQTTHIDSLHRHLLGIY